MSNQLLQIYTLRAKFSEPKSKSAATKGLTLCSSLTNCTIILVMHANSILMKYKINNNINNATCHTIAILKSMLIYYANEHRWCP